MSPSNYAKSLGVPSLKELADYAGLHIDTLQRWHESRPRVFRAICMAYTMDNAIVSKEMIIEALKKL